MAFDQNSIPAQLRSRDRARITAYASNLLFFNGNQWPSARTPRDLPRRLTANYTQPIIVKTSAAVLKGRTTTVEPGGESAEEKERAGQAETALQQVAEQNALDQLDFDTELDAAVLGDGVFKVWWDKDNNMIRISSPDPSSIWAWHWPDDPARIFRVAHQYELAPGDATSLLKLSGVGLAEAQRVSQRTKVTITEVWTTETMELWVNDVLAGEFPNAVGLIPYVIFPNIRQPKQLWGQSDVTVMRPIQIELNRALSQLSRIMELSGNPVAILSGVSQGGDIAIAPGEVWELPAEAKAALLDLLEHGNAGQHIEYISTIKRALFDIGETPATAFGGIERQLSGVAIELDLDPLVKKVERKRLLRTEAYQARNELILQTLAVFGGADFRGANHGIAWGSILPTDRDREVANAIALANAGIHARRTETDNLGEIDDPDTEFERWLDEQGRISGSQRQQEAQP